MTRATLRYDQASPTKVRQVLDLVRGLDVAEAREALVAAGATERPVGPDAYWSLP